MRKKAKKKLIITGICLVVVLAGIFVPTMVLSQNIHNVFDEVYYSFTQKPWARYTYCDIRGIDIWYREPTPQENILYYNEEYLDFADRISVSYSAGEKCLFYILSLPLNEGKFPATLEIVCAYTPVRNELKYLNLMLFVDPDYWDENWSDYISDEYMLVYSPDARLVAPVLEQNNITREDIARYQHYLLYEKFLPDWFAANGGPSKFSMGNLGEFTVADETYCQLGENWGLDE